MPDEPTLTNETPQTPAPDAPVALEIDGITVELAPDAEAPVAPTLAPETPATPETPAAPAEPVVPNEYGYLNRLTGDDRIAAATAILEGLTPEQRLALPAVMQIANEAELRAAQLTEQRITEQSNEDTRSTELVSSANALYDDIVNSNLTADQLTERMSDYADVAADTRQSEINDDIQASIWASARLVGVTQIPAEVANQAANADGWGGALNVYNHYFLAAAYNKGKEDQATLAGTAANGAAAIDKARLTDEIMAELRAAGRLRDDVPPVLSDGAPTSSGGFGAAEYKRKLEAGEQLTPDQIDAMTASYVSL